MWLSGLAATAAGFLVIASASLGHDRERGLLALGPLALAAASVSILDDRGRSHVVRVRRLRRRKRKGQARRWRLLYTVMAPGACDGLCDRSPHRTSKGPGEQAARLIYPP